MFGLPKLILIALVFAVVWWGVRWLNAVPHELPRRRSRPQQQRRSAGRAEIEAEDLVACRVCGAYVAASAPSCGRPDCPRPP
jgi:uncharacterized membrane-anchored protein